EVAGTRRRVELVGTTDPYGDGDAGTLVTVPGKMTWRHKLRPCMDHVALAAAGRFQTGARHLILDRDGAHSARHERWEREDARAYLTSLVGELLSRGHDYVLHIDMSSASLDGKSTTPKAAGDDHPGSFGYGPMPPRDDLEAPPPDELAAMARRRLGPLKQRLKEES
ncbi:MAG: hypothetical protein K8M05_14525, partial [Deltaproteobacteria bacterium]|nr:hypothetical protein [Kofleriaceae bacterium]